MSEGDAIKTKPSQISQNKMFFDIYAFPTFVETCFDIYPMSNRVIFICLLFELKNNDIIKSLNS